MNFNIDTLIKMGKAHSLHCEDDYIVVENDNFLVAAVFDGCSSGVDSHYASTKHKYLMKEVAEILIGYGIIRKNIQLKIMCFILCFQFTMN